MLRERYSINAIERTRLVLNKLKQLFDQYSLQKLTDHQHRMVDGMGEWFLTRETYTNWVKDGGIRRLVCHGKCILHEVKMLISIQLAKASRCYRNLLLHGDSIDLSDRW